MGTRDYRTKKIEYYGHPMGALNLYLYFLLPAFVIWKAVLFIWHATVPSAQFGTASEFLAELILLMLGIAALLSIYGVDRYAFFSNVVFLAAAGTSRVIQTFFPTLFAGSAVSADLQPLFTRGAQAAQSVSGALTAFFAAMGEGVASAAASAVSMLSSAADMAGSAGMDGIGMMGGAMGMMGDMGMTGGPAAGGSLIGKIVGIFVKTGEDFTLFANTVECGIFVLICLFFLTYFFANRKFFFSSLESFRTRDEAA